MTLITFIAAFFAVLGWILPVLIKVQALMPVFIIGSAVIAIGLVIADPIVQSRRDRRRMGRPPVELSRRTRIPMEPGGDNGETVAPLSAREREAFENVVAPIRDEIRRESA